MQTTSSVVFLMGKKVILRPAMESDIPLFLKWINDPEVRQYLKTFLPMTEKSERIWYESLSQKSNTDIFLVIEVKGQAIGTMGIHRINWKERIGTTGALIGEKDFWGKGYGTDAKMTLLNYAFNTLNLRKLMSTVKAFNTRSLAYSLHCGYKEEGRLREQFFVNGEYHDEIILGLFKHEWLPYWEVYCKK